MDKQNKDLEKIQSDAERKFKRRDMKKRKRMKVSGGSVKKLQGLIIKKGGKSND